MPLPESDLTAAVSRVSAVFAGAAAHLHEPVCGHCFRDEERALLRTPDALLPVDLVRRVAEKDPLHWDDQPAVVRRILPQLAALLASGTGSEAGRDDPRWCARGLAAARWFTWPAQERHAVEGFLAAWWRQTLRTAPADGRAAEVFASCAIASLTVGPWLHAWDEEAARSPSVRALRTRCAEEWREDLELSGSPFLCWWGPDGSEESAVETLRTWMLDVDA